MKIGAGLVAVLYLLLTGGQVQACPMLESAEPKVGSTVQGSVEKVSITFSTNILSKGSTLNVADMQDNTMNAGEAQSGANGAILIATVKPLQPGKYKVSWNVQCTHCEKPITGSYQFTVIP
jgi:methionine-rich copper-binding protein CopC